MQNIWYFWQYFAYNIMCAAFPSPIQLMQYEGPLGQKMKYSLVLPSMSCNNTYISSSFRIHTEYEKHGEVC